ncbi:MAG: pseudouridine synthase [Steroidobacteraceae bacterium]
MAQRIQKLLASAGLGSRRGIEEWILAGRVTLNGRIARLGDRAAPGDDLRIDGRAVAFDAAAHQTRQVLAYHKPVGEVTTRRDPQGRPTVFDRLPPPVGGRWIVIGRLDFNTSGLLLFTTDGEWAHRLMHPSSEVEREYLVRVRGRPEPQILERLRRGIELDDGPARFDRIEPREFDASHAWYHVVLREGRNREVRRLWQAAGYEVSRLMRVRYGPVVLPADLRPGQWRAVAPAVLDGMIGSLPSATVRG